MASVLAHGMRWCLSRPEAEPRRSRFSYSRETQIADRHQKMENVAAQAFHDNPNVRECVVVLLDVDGELYPYSTLSWYSRPT
jgi:hypothetical protein